jgi:hypothetical protein
LAKAAFAINTAAQKKEMATKWDDAACPGNRVKNTAFSLDEFFVEVSPFRQTTS